LYCIVLYCIVLYCIVLYLYSYKQSKQSQSRNTCGEINQSTMPYNQPQDLKMGWIKIVVRRVPGWNPWWCVRGRSTVQNGGQGQGL